MKIPHDPDDRLRAAMFNMCACPRGEPIRWARPNERPVTRKVALARIAAEERAKLDLMAGVAKPPPPETATKLQQVNRCQRK